MSEHYCALPFYMYNRLLSADPRIVCARIESKRLPRVVFFLRFHLCLCPVCAISKGTMYAIGTYALAQSVCVVIYLAVSLN